MGNKKNENIEYEKLAQDIYQALNVAEGIQTIEIQHNVKKKGKSGCEHQIDVYWEFSNLGEKHCVAIECKNYSSTVPVGRVRDFATVIDDIGYVKGIMISKMGFQRGAKKIAEQYGISLKEMRFPTDEDWEGRMRNLHLKIRMPFVVNMERKFIFDKEWIKLNYGNNVEFKFEGTTKELIVVHKDGEPINSLYELECKLIDSTAISEVNMEKVFEFGDDAFIIGIDGKYFKVRAIKYKFDIKVSNFESSIEGDRIAKAILKDVRTGERMFFNKSGEVHKTT